MIKIRKTIVLYVLLWNIYYLQDLLNIESSLSSRLLLVYLFAVSFYYFYKVNVKLHCTNSGIKAINILLLLVSLYGVWLILGGEDVAAYGETYLKFSRFYYLKAFLLSLLPVFFFYYQFRIEPLNSTEVHFFFILFSISYILLFYNNAYDKTEGDDEQEIVNNMGYYFLSLIPLLYLIKDKIYLKFALLLMIMIFVMMSLKRGAIIIGIVCFLLFIKNSYKLSTRRFRIIALLLSIFVFYFLYNYIIDFYQNSNLFQQRLEQTIEGNSSNRDILYSNMFYGFINHTSLLKQLFGSGAYATISLYGGYAHSDWLEFLINQGLLGVIIYIIYWLLLIKSWKKTKGPIYGAFGSFLLIYFMSSIYSMSINDYSTCASLCLGYFLAMSEQRAPKIIV